MIAQKRRHKEIEGKLPYMFGIVFIAVCFCLYGAIYAIDRYLPTPLGLNNEVENPERFIAERARDYLKPLVDIGPRVTGHPNNEIDAINYLTQKIEEIIEQSHKNQEISYNVTQHSGSFFLDFKPNGAINVYENIQNIAVKIHSENNSPHSVLINTHFDTYPNSPGGSNSGINVAVSLEIMRKLSKSAERPKHNIIFLFNGAEEANHCGSHAFISGHPLAQEVRVFINLEGIGAGGQELLFHTGPHEPWLLKYYDVPHPHANGGGEELFESRIVPYDTSFKTFSDFGIVGYDFTFYKNGYRTHTKYDGLDNIELGSFQHVGDNILALVKNLAGADELEHAKTEEGETVFFDVFGLFLVYYSMEVNMIINSVVAVISLVLLIWACIRVKLGSIKISLLYVTMLVFVVLLGWAIATAIVLLTASILNATDRSMSWYNSSLLIFLLYIAPTCASMLITTVILNKVIRHKTLTLTGKVLIQVHVVRLLWTVPLVVLTVMKMRVGLLFICGVLVNAIAMVIVHLLELYNHRIAVKIWPTIYVISTIIPTVFLYHQTVQDLTLIIPIFGRIGSEANPDLIVALFSSFATIVIGSYYVPLFTFIKKPWYVIMVLASFFIAGIVLAYTPVGFPYSSSETNPVLQRFSIYHTQRIIRDDSNNIIKSDSGFYFPKSDTNSPHSIEGEVSLLKTALSLESDCKITPGCGVPIWNSRDIQNVKEGVWIPTITRPFESEINYTISDDVISPTTKNYTVIVDGSDRIDLYISIRKGYTLTDLSLLDEIPENHFKWNGQKTYYISFIYGKTASSLSVSFVTEADSDTWSSPVADLGITTKFVHHDVMKTSEYQEFLNEFPEWAVITISGLAQYEHVVLI